jgi:hypothetical protein
MGKISTRTAATALSPLDTIPLIQSGADRRTVLGVGSIETPQLYGATGDGVTNDYTALQAAIDANYGGILFIPAGNYKIGTGLSIVKPIRIIGEASTLLNTVNYGTRIFTASAITLMTITEVASGSNEDGGGSLEYIKLDGASAGTIGLLLSGVGTTKWDFNRIHISNCITLGLKDLGNHSHRFYGCLFVGNGSGTATTEGGVYISDAVATTFIGCGSEANSGSGVIVVSGTYEFSWIGGTIEGNTKHGVYVAGTAYSSAIRDCVFEANNSAAAATTYDVNLSTASNQFWVLENLTFSGTNTTAYINNAGGKNRIIGYRGVTANKLLWASSAQSGICECDPLLDLHASSAFGGGAKLISMNPQNMGYTTPAVPASTSYTSRLTTNIRIHILTVGTVTDVRYNDPPQNDISIGASLTVGQIIYMPAGSCMAITYSVVPTWRWEEY